MSSVSSILTALLLYTSIFMQSSLKLSAFIVSFFKPGFLIIFIVYTLKFNLINYMVVSLEITSDVLYVFNEGE